jgi:hydroxymethylpyrimidine pyrophosphatase-like HAD family hydrolase
VDGVLTDELARPDQEVLRTIGKLHQQKEQLAFITGRSRKWLADHIFPALDTNLDWSSLYCVAEHGSIKGRGPNISSWELDQDYVISEEVKDKLYKISEKQQYQGLIEWDDTKEAMGTVESVHGDPGDEVHLEKTRKALKDYAEEAKKVAEEHNKKVVISTYGVDVTSKDLSKQIGAKWVLNQASNRDQPVYVFGDSKSDLIMAETAKQLGGANEVIFFWVGDGDIPESNSFKITSASKKFAEGTKKLLEELLDKVVK